MLCPFNFFNSCHVFKEGVWIWSGTRTPVKFEAWHPPLPQMFTTKENCAGLSHYFAYKWDDLPCSDKLKAVCQIEMDFS